LNVQNKDNRCFLYSILAHFAHQKTSPARPGPYAMHLKMNPGCLNLKGVKFPMALDRIEQFTNLNPQLPPLAVFGIAKGLTRTMSAEGHAFYPLKLPAIPSGVEPIGPIYLAPPDRETAGHDVLARETQLLFNHRPKQGKRFTYWRHMKGFSTQELYDKHMEACAEGSAQTTNLPKAGTELFFGNWSSDSKKLARSPYVAYTDLETMMGGQFAVITSFAYKIVAHTGDPKAEHQYQRVLSSLRCLLTDLEQLVEDSRTIPSHLKFVTPMQLTATDEEAFQGATCCWICEWPLGIDRYATTTISTGSSAGPRTTTET